MAEETNELWSTLMRFHREVVMPEVRDMVSMEINTSVGALRNEMNTHFDAMYKRFERIDTELIAINAGMKRLEERMDAIDIVALRSKLEELRTELAEAEQRLSALESRQ